MCPLAAAPAAPLSLSLLMWNKDRGICVYNRRTISSAYSFSCSPVLPSEADAVKLDALELGLLSIGMMLLPLE